MEVNIIGSDKQQLVRNNELASTSPDEEWERYVLVDTETLQIFARNKIETIASRTFQMTVS